MPKKTMIPIFVTTRDRLKGARVYGHETYDELLNRIFDERDKNGQTKKS